MSGRVAVLPGRRERFTTWLVPLLLSLLFVPAAAVRAQDRPDFTIETVSPQWQNDVYLLDARFRCVFNPHAYEALNKGVAIVVALDVEVMRKRSWYLPEKTVAELEQRYQLKYHALSERYLLTNLNTGVQIGFPSLQTMLDALGVVINLPVLDRQLLDRNGEYAARMRIRLDLDALPAPLRLLAYVTPGWRQSSEWHVWNLAE